MRWGKTMQQKYDEEQERIANAGVRTKVFAWWPKKCDDTGRKVWLEFVNTYEKHVNVADFCHRFYRYYEEIV